MTFGEMLKDKRMEWGLTQVEMAKKCNIPLHTYKYLEIYNGGYNGTYPTSTTIQKLRKAKVIDYTYKEVITLIELERKKHHRQKERKNAKSKREDIH